VLPVLLEHGVVFSSVVNNRKEWGMLIKSDWAVEKTVKLSKRFTVTMTVSTSKFMCEWDPDVPDPRDLTKAEMKRYRKARDELFAQIGERLGGAVLIIG
jgi:hypothetical protein